jgi:hypothetical protein
VTSADPPAPDPDFHIPPATQQQLTCGASFDEVFEQAADGHAGQLTPHQRGCEYCQAALTDLAARWAPVARAAAVPVVAPLGVAAAVMAAVTAHATSLANPGVAASTGLLGRTPHLGRWISAVIGVVIAAVVTVIALSTNTATRPRGITSSPTVIVTTTPTATTRRPSAPPSAAPKTGVKRRPSTPRPTTPRSKVPTGVPAGTGGQAATAEADTRDRQLVLLGAGMLLTGLSGLYLTRMYRRRKRMPLL